MGTGCQWMLATDDNTVQAAGGRWGGVEQNRSGQNGVAIRTGSKADCWWDRGKFGIHQIFTPFPGSFMGPPRVPQMPRWCHCITAQGVAVDWAGLL